MQAGASSCVWYGVKAAASWNLERPPDCNADFKGDAAWDIARDVWYHERTGRVLPSTENAQERKKAWENALGARKKKLQRAAQSQAQAQARREKQAECMKRLRVDDFQADLESLFTELKAEEEGLVLDDRTAVLKRTIRVVPVVQKLAKQDRHLEAVLFGLHAMVPAFDSEKWVDLWGVALHAFRAHTQESFDGLCKQTPPTHMPHPDTLRLVCRLADSLERVHWWEHASHWWEVAACIKSQAAGDDSMQVMSCELQSVRCQMSADQKAGESEFSTEVLLVRLLLMDKYLDDHDMDHHPRSRAHRQLRELCVRSIIECFQRIGRVDDALQFIRRHARLRSSRCILTNYSWYDVLRMLHRHDYTLRVAAGYGLSPIEWLAVDREQQRTWLVESDRFKNRIRFELGLNTNQWSCDEHKADEDESHFRECGWNFAWFSDPWRTSSTTTAEWSGSQPPTPVALLHATVKSQALKCHEYATRWESTPDFQNAFPCSYGSRISMDLHELPDWFCESLERDQRSQVALAAARWSAVMMRHRPPESLPQWAQDCFDPDMVWCVRGVDIVSAIASRR